MDTKDSNGNILNDGDSVRDLCAISMIDEIWVLLGHFSVSALIFIGFFSIMAVFVSISRLIPVFDAIGHKYPRAPFEVVGNGFHDMLGMHFRFTTVSRCPC